MISWRGRGRWWWCGLDGRRLRFETVDDDLLASLQLLLLGYRLLIYTVVFVVIVGPLGPILLIGYRLPIYTVVFVVVVSPLGLVLACCIFLVTCRGRGLGFLDTIN